MCKTIVNNKDAQSIPICIFEQNFPAQHFQHAITLAIITYENLTAVKIHNAHICSNIYMYFNKCDMFAMIK